VCRLLLPSHSSFASHAKYATTLHLLFRIECTIATTSECAAGGLCDARPIRIDTTLKWLS
jgi:hypothetical protein